jgi:hypothetical protein
MYYLSNHVWCSSSYPNGAMYNCRHMVSFNEHDDPQDWGQLIAPREFSFDTPILRPEVMKWLDINALPSTDKERSGDPRGWAMGDEKYRSHQCYDYSLWFLRRRDAMKFIKTYSEHGKPTEYLNYFNDDRRTLVNGKLVYKSG